MFYLSDLLAYVVYRAYYAKGLTNRSTDSSDNPKEERRKYQVQRLMAFSIALTSAVLCTLIGVKYSVWYSNIIAANLFTFSFLPGIVGIITFILVTKRYSTEKIASLNYKFGDKVHVGAARLIVFFMLFFLFISCFGFVINKIG